MDCRRIKTDDNKPNIVWFGSYGKEDDYILVNVENEWQNVQLDENYFDKIVKVVYDNKEIPTSPEGFIELNKAIYVVGKAKFYNDENIHDNFSTKDEAVRDSLEQRLSIIRNELWYSYNYGLPLLEKNKSKFSIDAEVINIIKQHPDVISIKSFYSNINKNIYSANLEIVSKYGEFILNL